VDQGPEPSQRKHGPHRRARPVWNPGSSRSPHLVASRRPHAIPIRRNANLSLFPHYLSTGYHFVFLFTPLSSKRARQARRLSVSILPASRSRTFVFGHPNSPTTGRRRRRRVRRPAPRTVQTQTASQGLLLLLRQQCPSRSALCLQRSLRRPRRFRLSSPASTLQAFPLSIPAQQPLRCCARFAPPRTASPVGSPAPTSELKRCSFSALRLRSRRLAPYLTSPTSCPPIFAQPRRPGFFRSTRLLGSHRCCK
jgi:hypothetical protein